jgi:transcriptional regulator with XRE-family HTH domain
MNDLTVGRVFRAIRIRKGWRQVDVAVRCGVSQQEVSLIERGRLEDVCMKTLRRIGRALEIDLPLAPRWRGPELERLLDADHAALVELVVRTLRNLDWEVIPEWTFNHYGERGSVDVLAWHAATRTLLIIEVKSRMVDVQDLLGSHGRKMRIAPLVVPGEFGWSPLAIGRVLVLPEGSTARDAVLRHAATFAATYPERNRRVRTWLERPDGPLSGVLFLRPTSRSGAPTRVARVRVTRPRPARVATNDDGAPEHDLTVDHP